MTVADFKAVFDVSPNPYMLLDRDLRYVAANQAYLRVTGASLANLLGRVIFDVFPHDPENPDNDSARLLRESLSRVLATGSSDVIAFIRYKVPRERNGRVQLEERFWSATHTPILDGNGRVNLILQHTVDVSELHQSERRVNRQQHEAGLLQRAERVQQTNELLDAERQHLRQLFAQAPGFVAVVRGPEHIFELANTAYTQMMGDRDMIGKPVREVLPEVAGQGYFEMLDRVFATGEPIVGRGMHLRVCRHPDAKLDDVFVDFLYHPLVDALGNVTGIFVQGHDITTQKRLEADREALLDQHRFLTESIPQQVWTADTEGELTSVNQRAADYFGAPRDQLLGSAWLEFLHADDVERCRQRWAESIETGREYEVEFRLRRADGVYRWHLGRALAMRDPEGAVSIWFGTNTDIDDYKRAQDALSERAAFEQQLIGIVSHDLRNPINAIGIAAALLRQRGHLDELQSKAVARIESSTDRARRMIRDFLDFTQARSSGRIPIAPAPANIREIAQHVFEEVYLMHGERPATFEHQGQEEGVWDGDRIAQVIGNLLGNAFQHGAPGGTVRLRTRGETDQITIEVQNEGAPIPAADIARLFRPFERGTGTAPSSERSVGLGLYISKQIVAAHQGTIDVHSRADKGTVFTVRLPRYLD
jgi:PAS domain S-box-containing protein